jgi:transposase
VKTYRPYAPDQSYLLPPSPSEWLPEGHLAYFILELLEDIDLGEIERVLQAKDHRGERPFSPRMMAALWLYGYAVGVTSSRKICTAHNLLKLCRAARRSKAALAPAT